MRTLKVVNRTRRTVVGTRVRVAERFWDRLRGFLGRPRPARGDGLLLRPCAAVHMFGMRFPLDLVFLSDDATVIHVKEALQPWRRTSRIPGATSVLELPVGTIDSTGTEVGDRLGWDDNELATPLVRRRA